MPLGKAVGQTDWIVPAMMLAFLLCGVAKGKDVYGAFARGAAGALPLIGKILPYMAAMMMAINGFRACGAMDWLHARLAPLASALHFPAELIPLFLLRPFSGSAGMALLADVYETAGVDAFPSFAGSIMLGSSETIFYTIALYFGAVGVKKSRYTLPAALLSMLAGAAASIWLPGLYYKWEMCVKLMAQM